MVANVAIVIRSEIAPPAGSQKKLVAATAGARPGRETRRRLGSG
jgi:hypothetical protein